jgi:hypothetical protein
MEILVALGILILGLTVIGSQIRSSWRASYEMKDRYTAMLLAESFVASLDSGLTVTDELDDEIEGDWAEWDELFVDLDTEFQPPPWAELYPEYGWRLTLEPCALEEMIFVTLEILFDPRRTDTDEDFDHDEAEVLFTLYLMRAIPTRIDLTRDFGMDLEEAEKLAEQLADVGDGGLDPYDLDPSVLQNLDLEELVTIAPTLLATFGLSMEEILPALPPELQQAIKELEGSGELEEEFEEEETGAGSGTEFAAPSGGRQPARSGGAGNEEESGNEVIRQGGAGVGTGGGRVGGRGGNRSGGRTGGRGGQRTDR